MVVTTLLTSLGLCGHGSGVLDVASEVLVAAANIGMFFLTFRVLTPKGVPTRKLVPGAAAHWANKPQRRRSFCYRLHKRRLEVESRQVPPCVRGSYFPRGDDLWHMRLSADIGRSWWNTSSLVCSVRRWLHEFSPLPGRSVVGACRTLPVTGSGVAAVAV